MIRPTIEEYNEFGVTVDAKPEDVKRQYRANAAHLHPDAGGDPEEFARMRGLYARILEASKTCRACNGTGRVMRQAGFAQLSVICENCNGRGEFDI